MGLDTTHGAWHGAYSAFMRWRKAVAKAAGIPLILMDGYHQCPTDPEVDFARAWRTCPPEDRGPMPHSRALWALDVDDELPLSWDLFAGHPLVPLLNHSDCEGEIAHEHLLPLAVELERLLPRLDEMGDAGGHVGAIGDKTRTFIAGLMRAHEAGEPLGFH